MIPMTLADIAAATSGTPLHPKLVLPRQLQPQALNTSGGT
jgi:hypothetical protein